MPIVVVESQPVQFQIGWSLLGQKLGIGYCGYEWSKEQRHNPFSIAYCCPACGNLWARIEVIGARSKWFFQRRACPTHGIGYLMPSNDSDPKIDAAPAEVLQREILLYAEQLQGNNPEEDYCWTLILDGI